MANRLYFAGIIIGVLSDRPFRAWGFLDPAGVRDVADSIHPPSESCAKS